MQKARCFFLIFLLTLAQILTACSQESPRPPTTVPSTEQVVITFLGERYLETLQKETPGLVEANQRLLLCPVVYTDTESVFLLEEFSQLSDGCLAYNPDRIRATDETSSLYRLLRAADRIKIPTEAEDGLFLYQSDRLVGETHSRVWCLTFAQGQEKSI